MTDAAICKLASMTMLMRNCLSVSADALHKTPVHCVLNLQACNELVRSCLEHQDYSCACSIPLTYCKVMFPCNSSTKFELIHTDQSLRIREWLLIDISYLLHSCTL